MNNIKNSILIFTLGSSITIAQPATPPTSLPKKTLAAEQGAKNVYEPAAKIKTTHETAASESIKPMGTIESVKPHHAMDTDKDCNDGSCELKREKGDCSDCDKSKDQCEKKQCGDCAGSCKHSEKSAGSCELKRKSHSNCTMCAHSEGVFGIGLEYTNTNWSALTDGVVSNGAPTLEITFARKHGTWQTGFDFVFWSPARMHDDWLWAMHVAFETKKFLLDNSMWSPFLGLGVGVGAYQAWPLQQETTTEITFSKKNQGALFGVIPEVGIRFGSGKPMFVDLKMNYKGYMDKPSLYLGGWSAGLQVGFIR